MTRGYRPVVAINEAQQEAKGRGCLVTAVSTGSMLPFDFVIYDRGRIRLVRIRRLRYAEYEIADIAFTCREEIAALRAMPVSPDISRELHVRGPERYWHHYRVLQDRIEEVRE